MHVLVTQAKTKVTQAVESQISLQASAIFIAWCWRSSRQHDMPSVHVLVSQAKTRVTQAMGSQSLTSLLHVTMLCALRPAQAPTLLINIGYPAAQLKSTLPNHCRCVSVSLVFACATNTYIAAVVASACFSTLPAIYWCRLQLVSLRVVLLLFDCVTQTCNAIGNALDLFKNMEYGRTLRYLKRPTPTPRRIPC